MSNDFFQSRTGGDLVACQDLFVFSLACAIHALCRSGQPLYRWSGWGRRGQSVSRKLFDEGQSVSHKLFV